MSGVRSFGEFVRRFRADQSGATEQFDGLYLSANSFSLIGVRPLLGRDFRTEDDRPGAPPVVMLSERVWRTRFAGQRSLIGLRIRVNGTPATVVGVMPPGFAFPNEVAVWQPLGAAPAGQPEARSRRELEDDSSQDVNASEYAGSDRSVQPHRQGG